MSDALELLQLREMRTNLIRWVQSRDNQCPNHRVDTYGEGMRQARNEVGQILGTSEEATKTATLKWHLTHEGWWDLSRGDKNLALATVRCRRKRDGKPTWEVRVGYRMASRENLDDAKAVAERLVGP